MAADQQSAVATAGESAVATAAQSAGAAELILVLAPTGQDGRLIAQALGSTGLDALAMSDLAQLTAAIAESAPDGPGLVIIAEEALADPQLHELLGCLSGQPTWSELPIVLITGGGVISAGRMRVLDSFGPAGRATLIERPFRAATLVSAANVALRSRRRQYQVRDLLARERAATIALSRKAAELEASNNELEQFAYVASHDLQEPLRMIGSYLQIIERRYAASFDDKAKTYFRYVTDGALRMSAMIKGMLEYARLGHHGQNIEAIASAQTVDDALKNLEQRLASTGAEVAIGALPRVSADRVMLTQVFQNLIGNAIKFCERKPAIRVEARRDGAVWVFSVADNGIGIPAGSGERLFQIFQRAHGGDRFRGTGIGLATCKKLVELQRGRIWFESSEGEGSTFFFTIPASD